MPDSWMWTCPLTQRPLTLMSRQDAEGRLGPLTSLNRTGSSARAIGPTDEVFADLPSGRAYPVIDGIPVLLSPERLEAAPDQSVDLRDAKFAEAYAEMDFYNSGPVEDPGFLSLVQKIANSPSPADSFPDDTSLWIDATYDGPAQLECYRQMTPLRGRTVMQIGGGGLHAVKFLLAGARLAVLVTPMIGEARRARWLASSVGVQNRLHVSLGIAEELPVPSDSIDGIFTGGCAHHMQLSVAMSEVNRVLRSGGSFAAAEPWRAPLYAVGTTILGKREANAHCRPLTAERVQPVLDVFPEAEIVHHGALTRYALLALSKAGHRTTATRLLPVFAKDDALAGRLGLRRHGSSVSLIATKQ